MTRQLSVTVNKQKYTVQRKVRLILSDNSHSYSGEFNHPVLVLTIDHKDSFGPDTNTMEIEFQRDRSGATTDGEMEYAVATLQNWSRCYGGHVLLSHDVNKPSLNGFPFSLKPLDKARDALKVKIAKAIQNYNLYYVSNDECVQTIKALEKLGCYVETEYYNSSGQKMDPHEFREKRTEARQLRNTAA